MIFPNLLKRKLFWLVVVAAGLKSLSLIYVNYAVAWFAYAGLFIAILELQKPRSIFYCGLVFGGISSALLNFWMIPAVQYYAQGSILLGIVCWALSAALLAIVYGLQLVLFAKLRFAAETKYALIINALLMACWWVLAEWLRAELFSGMPWLNYSIGVSQASHLFLVQPAAIGSVYVLSFLLILANYFLGYAIYQKQWKLLVVPLGIFIGHFSAGFLMYQRTTDLTRTRAIPKIKTALVLASLPPETVWDEHNGNALVQNLLSLNQRAIQANPDLILWSETIVPWTYAPDDDFLRALAQEISGKKAYSLVGMNTAVDVSANTIHNSAYLFNPSGYLQARYDKQELLTLVEKPLFATTTNIILPFLAGSGLQIMPGKNRLALPTPWGKAGLLLCNESAGPTLTNAYSQSGASFLINLGNDGWFANYFITRQHFYNNRLRAVEARKDLVVNNNRGISGIIRANGDIAARFQQNASSVPHVEIYPNQLPATDYRSFIFLILCLTAVLASSRLYAYFKKPTLNKLN